ncbi:MAG TPA: DUF2017 family protein [Gaiellaceae bacterium]|nr:DUF2017 family protein [Gaiellaceae bacterium]
MRLRREDDGYRLDLGREERALLRRLAAELRDGVEEQAGDPSLQRLFPAAYEDDDDAAEFDRLVRPTLVEAKREALATLERTASADRLTPGELEAWVAALNDLRLVLGTRLDVTEEMDERRWREPGVALYGWLTWVQGTAIEALAAEL